MLRQKKLNCSWTDTKKNIRNSPRVHKGDRQFSHKIFVSFLDCVTSRVTGKRAKSFPLLEIKNDFFWTDKESWQIFSEELCQKPNKGK